MANDPLSTGLTAPPSRALPQASSSMTVFNLIHIISKRKWIFLMTCVGTFVPATLLWRSQPIYFSSAANVQLKPSDAILAAYYPIGTLAGGQIEVVKSYPVLLESSKRIGAIPNDLSWEQAQQVPEYLSQMKNLRSSLRVEKVRETEMLAIGVSASNPMNARDFSNAVASAFVDYYNQVSAAPIEDAIHYVTSQREDLKNQLAEAEQRLKQFKLDNNVLAIASEMEQATRELRDIEIEREEISSRVAQIQSWIPREREDIPVDSMAGTETGRSDPILSMHLTHLQEVNQEEFEKGNQLTAGHPDMESLQQRRDHLNGQILERLRTLQQILAQKLGSLDRKELQFRGDNGRLLDLSSSLTTMEGEVGLLRSMAQDLERTFQETRLKQLAGSSKATIIQPAILPAEPDRKRNSTILVAGLMLGLLLGTGLALIRESFDFSLSNILEIEQYLGLRVLGVIPHHHLGQPGANGTDKAVDRPTPLEPLMVHREPKSTVAEAFRSIRMHILRERGKGRMYMVCSSLGQEGKSFVSLNLAMAFAQGGFKTLLVECNLRRPSIAKSIGFSPSAPGVLQIAQEGKPWAEAVSDLADLFVEGVHLSELQKGPGLDKLHFILSGGIATHPVETLERMLDTPMLDEARAQYDVIILDTPPILAVADAVTVGQKTDGAVLVYRTGTVARDLLHRACDLLRSNKVNLLGLVMNDVQGHLGGGYYYYMRYTYGMEGTRKGKAKAGETKRWREPSLRV